MKKVFFSLFFFSSLMSAQDLSTYLKDKTFELQHFTKNGNIVTLDLTNPYDANDNTYRKRPSLIFTVESSLLKAEILGYCNITFATYDVETDFLNVEERGGTTLIDCGGDEETDYFNHLTGNFQLQNQPEKVYYSFSENEKTLTLWMNENHKMVFQEKVLSVEEFEFRNSISIYPNPTSSLITINQTNKNYNIVKLLVVDNKGKTILVKENETSVIDVSKLANGIFFLKLETENQLSITKKFIKN